MRKFTLVSFDKSQSSKGFCTKGHIIGRDIGGDMILSLIITMGFDNFIFQIQYYDNDNCLNAIDIGNFKDVVNEREQNKIDAEKFRTIQTLLMKAT